MSVEHKRPLYAFVVVAIVCGLFLGHALRSEALTGVLRDVVAATAVAPHSKAPLLDRDRPPSLAAPETVADEPSTPRATRTGHAEKDASRPIDRDADRRPGVRDRNDRRTGSEPTDDDVTVDPAVGLPTGTDDATVTDTAASVTDEAGRRAAARAAREAAKATRTADRAAARAAKDAEKAAARAAKDAERAATRAAKDAERAAAQAAKDAERAATWAAKDAETAAAQAARDAEKATSAARATRP